MKNGLQHRVKQLKSAIEAGDKHAQVELDALKKLMKELDANKNGYVDIKEASNKAVSSDDLEVR